MSYLLMQILLCLLVAATIGFMVGWLFRGFDFNKRLKEYEEYWQNLINETETEWNNKIQGLTRQHKNDLQIADREIERLNNEIVSHKNNHESTLEKLKEVELLAATKNSQLNEAHNIIEELTTLTNNHKNEAQTAKAKLEEVLSAKKQALNEINSKLEKVTKEKLVNSNKLLELQKTINEKESQLAQNKTQLANLEKELNSAKAKIEILSKEANEHKEGLNQAKFEAENAYKQYHLAEQKLKERANDNAKIALLNQEIERLKAQLEETKLQAQERENQAKFEIENNYKHYSVIEQELKTSKEKLAKYIQLEDELTKTKAELEAVKEVNQERVKKLQKELQDCAKEKLDTTTKADNDTPKEPNLPVTTKPQLLSAPKDGKKDNLQLIKGVGKVLEKTLNELGIYHFDQIANWTQQEIDYVNEKLAFSGRIEREEWVKQAKKLASGEETEFAKRVKKGEVPTSKSK